MFSWFSDIIRNYSEYQNPHIRRILWNTAMTYKIGTKALSAILKQWNSYAPHLLILVQYHPNDYSNLEESKADGLSCSPIKVPVLIWQCFIDCGYLASVVLHFFYFVAPPSAYFTHHICRDAMPIHYQYIFHLSSYHVFPLKCYSCASDIKKEEGVGDITIGRKPARRGRVNPISSSSVSEVHEDRRWRFMKAQGPKPV